MTREAGILQRDVVGRRIAFSDRERFTKYILPFVNRNWNVDFTVLDLLGSSPRILAGPLHWDGSRLRSPHRESELRPIEAIALDRFASLIHFDPWWAFRGVSEVPRVWIDAIFATNIARPFRHEGRNLKIHDLRFSDGMMELEGLIAKDEAFHVVRFQPGGLDLLGLRPRMRGAPRAASVRPAKAL